MNFQGFCGYIALVGMSLYVVSIESQKSKDMRKVAHSLCQRTEYKLPLRDADVWDLESLVVDNLILVEKNIKVYIPWALVNHLLAAHGVLDIL